MKCNKAKSNTTRYVYISFTTTLKLLSTAFENHTAVWVVVVVLSVNMI